MECNHVGCPNPAAHLVSGIGQLCCYHADEMLANLQKESKALHSALTWADTSLRAEKSHAAGLSAALCTKDQRIQELEEKLVHKHQALTEAIRLRYEAVDRLSCDLEIARNQRDALLAQNEQLQREYVRMSRVYLDASDKLDDIEKIIEGKREDA